MYPLIDDVCKKMTKYIHEQIEKQNPDGFDTKEVIINRSNSFEMLIKHLLFFS